MKKEDLIYLMCEIDAICDVRGLDKRQAMDHIHQSWYSNDLRAALSEAISRCGDDSVYEDLHRKFGHLL